jgi:hypothetical protein
MHVQPHSHLDLRGSGLRRLMLAAFVASFICLLAAIPTGSALASSDEGSVEVTTPVSLENLDPLLAAVPVNALETSGTGLTSLSLISDLNTLPGVTGPVQALLDPLLAIVLGNPDTTLAGLVGDVTGEGVSTNPADVVSMLLGKLTPTQGTALIEELFGSVPSSSLNSLLGSTLTAQPFTQTTVGDLANKLGITAEKLAEDVGTTALQLPATATALTAPLANSKLLTVLDGPEGLKITTVETKEAAKEREAKESKEAKERSESTGNSSSTGNSGSNGAAGGTSVVVNLPAAAVAATPVPTPAVASKTVAKIKILSHKVKGHIATLVLQIPAAGKVLVSGGGVRAVGKGATKSERLTVRIPLSKAGTASLRKRHNRLSVALKASFKSTSGSSSSAGVTVHFA